MNYAEIFHIKAAGMNLTQARYGASVEIKLPERLMSIRLSCISVRNEFCNCCMVKCKWAVIHREFMSLDAVFFIFFESQMLLFVFIIWHGRL